MKYIIINLLFLISVPYLFSFGGGDGTEAYPYQISTKAHLELLADSVNNIDGWSSGKYFKVMNNITESVTTIIGIALRTFQGNFDGQNYTITLAIDRPGGNNVGLFGSTMDAVIKNVIVDGYVSGDIGIGGIVGYLYNTSISDCINNASVSGAVNIGGIAGRNHVGTISDCINTGNVSGLAAFGGIAGLCHATISDCINTGNVNENGPYVSAFVDVGGIVGRIVDGGTISDCMNNASIRGNYNVGGIAGKLRGTISNCINTGSISGIDFVGGINGVVTSNASISNCMNIGNITGKGHVGGINGCRDFNNVVIITCVNYGFVKGIDTGVGGINGHLYDTIENCINTGIVEGEDASVTGPIQGAP